MAWRFAVDGALERHCSSADHCHDRCPWVAAVESAQRQGQIPETCGICWRIVECRAKFSREPCKDRANLASWLSRNRARDARSWLHRPFFPLPSRGLSMNLRTASNITVLVPVILLACSAGDGDSVKSSNASFGGSAGVGSFVQDVGQLGGTAGVAAAGNAGTANGAGVTPGMGGGFPGNGGSIPGSGGGIIASGGGPVGNGGALVGSGGTLVGSGGTLVGSGGALVGSGGALVGSGGTPMGDGGSPVGDGGSEPERGGSTPEDGGSNPGQGGASSGCEDVLPPDQDPSYTCANWKDWGMCTQAWFAGYCASTCGTCGSTGSGGTEGRGGSGQSGSGQSGSGQGGSGQGGSGQGGGQTLPPLEGGQDAWASRYWDCCKPHCGWNGHGASPVPQCDINNGSLGGNDASNACDGGPAFMCHSFAPWAVSDQLAYGFVAYNNHGDTNSCGRCYQIQFTGASHNGGADPGCAAIQGKQMIVQLINIGGLDDDQFDLMIPGGGVGAMNGCSTQWGGADLGAQYGGFLSNCTGEDRGTCVLEKCQSVFGAKWPDLMDGCRWFVEWYHAANNPSLKFKEVTCPDAITSVSGVRR